MRGFCTIGSDYASRFVTEIHSTGVSYVSVVGASDREKRIVCRIAEVYDVPVGETKADIERMIEASG